MPGLEPSGIDSDTPRPYAQKSFMLIAPAATATSPITTSDHRARPMSRKRLSHAAIITKYETPSTATNVPAMASIRRRSLSGASSEIIRISTHIEHGLKPSRSPSPA